MRKICGKNGDSMKIAIHLRDTRTGRTGIKEMDWGQCTPTGERHEELYAIESMFTEGNYSCDDNRAKFLYGADTEWPCSEGKIAVDKIADLDTGEVLFTGLNP